MLTDKGHTPDSQKVEAITEMPPPTDVSGVQRFLGMVTYLGKYVEGLSDLSEPLRQLTKESVAWSWTIEHQFAFEEMKSVLTKAPVLVFF